MTHFTRSKSCHHIFENPTDLFKKANYYETKSYKYELVSTHTFNIEKSRTEVKLWQLWIGQSHSNHIADIWRDQPLTEGQKLSCTNIIYLATLTK